jgi:hypothetical protein
MSWMKQLRACSPRAFSVAIKRNSMGASLALLTGVLLIDAAVSTDPPRRRRRTAKAPAPAVATDDALPPPQQL